MRETNFGLATEEELLFLFDADGVLFSPPYHITQDIVSANEAHLLKHVIDVIESAPNAKISIAPASNRQSPKLDQKLAVLKKTHLVSEVFGNLHEYLENQTNRRIFVETYTLADTFNALKDGSAFTNQLDVDAPLEHEKFLILYSQLHKVAERCKGKKIRVFLYDDRLNIIEGLARIFGDYPALIPPNVELNLYHYGSEAGPGKIPLPLETPKLISTLTGNAESIIDRDFRSNLIKLFNLCWQYSGNKIDPDFNQHDKSEIRMISLIEANVKHSIVQKFLQLRLNYQVTDQVSVRKSLVTFFKVRKVGLQTINIGLIFKFGEPHETDKRTLLTLSNVSGYENLNVKVIDWRFKPNESDFFDHMPEGHINYIKNDYLNIQRKKFLASLTASEAATFNNYLTDLSVKQKFDIEVEKYYQRETGRNLLEDAANYYKFTNELSLEASVDAYLNSNLNGIFIPGTNFDPLPQFCSDDYNPAKAPPDNRREVFERLLVRKAIERGIPVLGVCAGTWLVATCFDGAKTRALSGDELNVHKEGLPRALTQDELTPPNQPDDVTIHPARLGTHGIVFTQGSKLHDIVNHARRYEATPNQDGTLSRTLQHKKEQSGSLLSKVSSTHWRAVAEQKNGQVDDNNLLTVAAKEPTFNTVEAVETRFGVPVLGVQFHAELSIPMWITKSKNVNPGYPANRRILETFAEAAKTHANKTLLNDSVKTNNSTQVKLG